MPAKLTYLQKRSVFGFHIKILENAVVHWERYYKGNMFLELSFLTITDSVRSRSQPELFHFCRSISKIY